MRKEIYLAIIGGIAIGLLVAFGMWRINSSLNNKTENTSITPIPENSKITPQGLKLTVAKPQNNDVVTQSPVKLSGITKANSWLAISGEENDYILKSNQDGSFEQDIELISGVNQLIIVAYEDNGFSFTQKLNIVYSTEFEK